MAAIFGSTLRMCSLIDSRALWILPSCTAFCTACEGGTASTSARTSCGAPLAIRGDGATLLFPGGVGGTTDAVGMVGRGPGGGATGEKLDCAPAVRPGRLLSTTFLNFETLRNSSWASW